MDRKMNSSHLLKSLSSSTQSCNSVCASHPPNLNLLFSPMKISLCFLRLELRPPVTMTTKLAAARARQVSTSTFIFHRSPCQNRLSSGIPSTATPPLFHLQVPAVQASCWLKPVVLVRHPTAAGRFHSHTARLPNKANTWGRSGSVLSLACTSAAHACAAQSPAEHPSGDGLQKPSAVPPLCPFTALSLSVCLLYLWFCETLYLWLKSIWIYSSRQ